MISIVMPAHNEEGYLESSVKGVVLALRERGMDFEVIVAENGSSDRTKEEADSLAATFQEVVSLSSPEADYGVALRTGFLTASGQIVVNFDVDLVDVGFLDEAISLMSDESIVMVVGSKRSKGSEDQRGAVRKLITAVFSSLLHYGFGMHVSDTHGLKALRREPLLPLARKCHFGRDIFDTELVLRTERAQMRIAEIPVSVSEKRPPRTSITRRIPRTVTGLIRLRLALWRD